MTITPEWLAIILQGLVIVFIAGKGWSRLESVETRMSRYDERLQEKDKANNELIDRLARIEEKLNHIDITMSQRNYRQNNRNTNK